ncbi:MAG TPA: MBL fold metallo-hydrolase [Myxococcota bacterium]|nr:MBL fold metallo-hydrolase [Myxococcota bacterium]
MADSLALESRRVGSATVLFGPRGGKYPDGNSLLVQGREESLLIDPSLGLLPRRNELPHVDRAVLSHCHEDHLAGLFLFPHAACHVHEADRIGLQSLDDFLAIYGYSEPIESPWRRALVEQFHYAPRPDARGFTGERVFELGGGVRVRAIPAPGHTRGHCVLLVEPDGALYLGDIDLSSFGPYYGDAWSSLPDFERSLALVREIEARTWITFHHIGVIDGRAALLARLDRYAAVIRDREERLVAYLAEPHTLAEIAEHRFVYRPGDAVAFAEAVERRSMAQHIERLCAQGRVKEVEPGRYHAPRRS